MRFSIVTPSLRSSAQLRLCIPSVADQGVELEHIVQDSCSDDDTKNWLPQDKRVTAIIEKDQGMYDAINRGLKRAKGEILAYLNCDEQYLPGALSAVGEYFDQHPEVDVVFGDGVVVAEDGSYLFHRRALLPWRAHTYVSGNLAVMTCATFFRRRVVSERGLFFDTRYRAFADAEWVLSLIKNRLAMALLHQFTSSFTLTGQNLSFTTVAEREGQERLAKAPRWAQRSRAAIIGVHRVRKLLAGHYSYSPFDYAIYTHQSPDKRFLFRVGKPTAVWKVPAVEGVTGN